MKAKPHSQSVWNQVIEEQNTQSRTKERETNRTELNSTQLKLNATQFNSSCKCQQKRTLVLNRHGSNIRVYAIHIYQPNIEQQK